MRLARYIARKGNVRDHLTLAFLRKHDLIRREVDEFEQLVVWHKPLSPELLNELEGFREEPDHDGG